MATITVVDNEDMLPLPFAHVWNESQMAGAITNMDGVATVPDEDMPGTWRVSFVGYTTKNVAVTEPSSIMVKLVRGVDLDEVVIRPEQPPGEQPPGEQPPAPNYTWLLLAGLALVLLNRK